MDDFGTGESSLSMVAEMPVDLLYILSGILDHHDHSAGDLLLFCMKKVHKMILGM